MQTESLICSQSALVPVWGILQEPSLPVLPVTHPWQSSRSSQGRRPTADRGSGPAGPTTLAAASSVVSSDVLSPPPTWAPPPSRWLACTSSEPSWRARTTSTFAGAPAGHSVGSAECPATGESETFNNGSYTKQNLKNSTSTDRISHQTNVILHWSTKYITFRASVTAVTAINGVEI